mmetsp:Transcript_7592/g.13240  ORF Transcript_7592/g.13240 Transcript_7592/m.13240 type:complete len:238 (-) Transcript_7592:20-733(-)
MSSVTRKTLRILCLHGYSQNATSFRMKTGSFRGGLKKIASLDYIDAPLKVEIVESKNDEKTDESKNIKIDDDPRTWWKFNNDGTIYYEYQDSIKLVENYVEKNGPFDGIFGFSQGAAFGALLCALSKTNKVFEQFKFAILVSGFKPRAHDLQKPYFSNEADLFETPSFHMIGEADTIIRPKKSLELAERFVKPTIYKHSGGHFVDGNRQTTIPAVKEFLQPFFDAKNDVVENKQSKL